MPEAEPLPTTHRALKVCGAGKVELQDDCPLPTLEDDQVLVRVRCVGINPVDAKVLDMGPIVGATLGCEFAGDVAAVGRAVTNERLAVGTAVFGTVYGNHPGQPDNGAFAEFVAVAGDLVYLLPNHLSYEEACSLGVALPTVGMSIYYPWKFDFPRPQPPGAAVDASQGAASDARPELSNPSDPSRGRADEEGLYVLVYGGSTAMGAVALQLLRRSGWNPVSTCSPRNFDMVRGLGAAQVFDYHEPGCGEAIRAFTGDTLAYALDCITDLSSMRICYAAMGKRGGKYMGLDPLPLRAHTRRDVKPDWTLTFTMFNKALNVGRPFARPARPRDRAFASGWFAATQPLIDAPGQLRPHPIDRGSGGLHGLPAGLDRMRKGDVSGVKLVYALM